ncbi:ERF family protein [Streptococcus equi]|uniref:ERF family protein n=1 Tax=Streptococcus equi TaxID=1336 RepID=UPI001E2D7A9C|nr:ERF family protein [Streptococcus equi]
MAEHKESGIFIVLRCIQADLIAPKGQYNSFGKYAYRSAEDILEALKPLLKKYDASIVLSDEIVQVGERYYVEATATLYAMGECVGNKAYAREDETKKGMDGAQITGAASSYARKYALNGLLAIDDNNDADTDAYHNQNNQSAGKTQKTNQNKRVSKSQQRKLLLKIMVLKLLLERKPRLSEQNSKTWQKLQEVQLLQLVTGLSERWALTSQRTFLQSV